MSGLTACCPVPGLLGQARVGRIQAGVVEVRATGRLRADPAPFLALTATGPSGDVRFGRAVDGTRLRSGVVVVADVAEHNLVFLDSTGRVLRRVGRRGRGPGEFQYLSWLERCSTDSLFTWDPILSRVEVRDTAGRLARGFRLPGRPARISCSARGHFAVIMRQPALQLPSADSPVYLATLVFATSAGDSVGTLGDIRVGQNRPLAAIAQIAMAQDRLYVGNADSALVVAYDAAGKVVARVATGQSARPATKAHYERAIQKLVVGMGESERGPIVERLRSIPMPQYLPAYSALAADPEGALWVVSSVPGDGATLIEALGVDGVRLGSLWISVELDLYEVGEDYVLGAYEAADGEQRILGVRVRRIEE